MSEIVINGTVRQQGIQGDNIRTDFDDYYNVTPLNGVVALTPSSPGWGGYDGVTQFVSVEPSGINVHTGGSRKGRGAHRNDGVFGEFSKIHPDGTYYPPELGAMVQALGSYGYDISAFTAFVELQQK